MAKKTLPPAEEQRPTRRSMLKWLGGSALLATGAALSWNFHVDTDEPQLDELATFKGFPAGDLTRDINQNEINDQYRIYIAK